MLRRSGPLSILFFVLAANLPAQVPAPLRPYLTCHFGDDLALVEKEPTPPAALGRTAMTLLGPKQVPITRGERLVFAYPTKSPFVRATIEQLPPKTFPQGKADLISAFDKLIASDDNVERNYTLKPQINGFEAHGLDRKDIGGVVVGAYLLIDDTLHTVISINFLNQPADDRSYATLREYSLERDAFLSGYTACIRANLHAVSAAAVPAAKSKPTTKTAAPQKKATHRK